MPGKSQQRPAGKRRVVARKAVVASRTEAEELRHREAEPTAEQTQMGSFQFVGNRTAGTLLNYARPGAGTSQSIARRAEASKTIQRATFAELMAFWKVQEQKQSPEKAQQEAKTEAKLVAPESEPDEGPEDEKEESGVSEVAKEGGGSPNPESLREEAKVGSEYTQPGGQKSESLSPDEASEAEEAEEKQGGFVYSQPSLRGEEKAPGAHYSQPGEKSDQSDEISPDSDEAPVGVRYSLPAEKSGEQKGPGSHYSNPDQVKHGGSLSESLSPDSDEPVVEQREVKGPGSHYSNPDQVKVPGSKYSNPDEVKHGGSLSDSLSPDSDEEKAKTPSPQPIVANKTKVKYLETSEARKEFELNVGGGITQGGQPYDTSKMYSKFKGDGFGIYVMGKDGKFYSNSHKIGLFHHSSFLGGGDVTGAGEIKVSGGNLDFITNKSGHYFPGPAQMAQTLIQIKGASGFGSAKVGVFDNGKYQDDIPGGAAQWLDDNRHWSPGGSDNKDTTKYATKQMSTGHKGEKEDSVGVVRFLIQDYAGKAKAGKLKTFNKPNPAFGDTLADIKALILAEFGWDESDLETYKEVIENWNNDKPIGEPPGAPPPVKAQSISESETSITPDDTDQKDSGQSGGGRDWNAELEELLLANPNPDWEALGLTMDEGSWSLSSPGGMSFVTARAEHKVKLLKGEAKIDDLRPSDPF